MEEIDLSVLPVEREEKHSNSDSCMFKKITPITDDQVKSKVKALSFEQRVVFDKFVEVCKKLIMQHSKYAQVANPTRMIVTGMYYNQVIYLLLQLSH